VRASCLLLLLLPGFALIATQASAVTIDWVTVGDPGNAADTTGFGSVGYSYKISKYEITNAQYAQFLNAKAVADPLGLYSTSMGSGFGGITRSGSKGSFSYSATAGRESMPVNFVSFYDALRFVNWLDNGQGSGDTETGAYTLLGGFAIPSNGATVTRNGGAKIFLTSEDEWYKAAYYDAASSSYFAYPAGTDAQTLCAAPGGTPNTANCNFAVGDLSNVGSYSGSASPNGTFDQAGNVWEWNEWIAGPDARGLRGGAFNDAGNFAASVRAVDYPEIEDSAVGFRVARLVPEPGTGLLGITALSAVTVLAASRRRPAKIP
jgi:sulfatase modifying factor 1